MADVMRVGLCQINSQDDKNANISRAEELIDEAAARGARLITLPEYVDYLGADEAKDGIAESIPGPTTDRFAAKAKQHNAYILGGSIIAESETPGKFYNTSTLFNPQGELIATYRKIHLFDIDITGNVSANESNRILPGDQIITAEVDGHKVGLTICYDLRFPELYRLLALEGAEIMFVPAAFTEFTGKDHWHTLLKARAVENQCFVVAPGQFGPHGEGKKCYGHSLAVDPWGTFLADAPNQEGVVIAELDFDYLNKIRTQVPSLANRRPAAYEGQKAGV
jgi:deaminated glutathione amidase